MLGNHLRILLRKQPLFTLFNFGGLLVGMTAAMLLYRYVRYELDYDNQSPNRAQIWRVFNQTVDANGVVTTEDANTHSAVGPTLKAEVAGVADYARLYCGNAPECNVRAGESAFELKRCFITDPGFLRMFPQRFLSGNPLTCLNEPWNALLTAQTAERLFGSRDVLGQRFKITTGNLAGEYTVSAIVADVPENTHLKFDMLGSYNTRYAQGHQDNFTGYWDYNYFQMAEGADPGNARAKLREISATHLKNEGIRLDMQAFSAIHLHSNLTYELEPNGSARVVQFLSLIALAILCIAFINYVNLTTALSQSRAKEVGIRKAVGASKSDLTAQFMQESALLCGMAFVFAVLLYHILLPEFGRLAGRELAADNSLLFWAPVVLSVGACAFVAGLYPALSLSRFKVVEALQAKGSGNRGVMSRKTLVVFQFACSVTLIFAVLVIRQQLDFMRRHELGAQIDQVLTLKTVAAEGQPDSVLIPRFERFVQACTALAGVKKCTSSSMAPGLGINGISGSSHPLHWISNPDYVNLTSYMVDVDADFFTLFNIPILAGVVHAHQDLRQRLSTVIINRAMLEALGFPNAAAAIGQKIAYKDSEGGASMTVGAVVENFHIESLKTRPKPTFYFTHPVKELGYFSLKVAPDQVATTLGAIQGLWAGIYPEKSFQYWFLDENFALQYRNEAMFSRVFALFALLAILISCLGLLSLATFDVGRRTKEIGIRKVLGASVHGVVGLLSRDFLLLVGIALVIAVPVATYFMNAWLRDFAYRATLGWPLYAGVTLITFGVAFLTVGFQALRAALVNPVKSLKNE